MSSLRLVLVGKTGAGKSSAGNTILGKEEFKACVSFSAVTAECQKGEGEVNGRPVTVVDTPGIADLKVSVEEAKDRVAECFRMSAPGPHVFLLVIKLDRFTAEEKQAADVIRGVFGKAALKHTMVLFTNGDQLENPNDLEALVKNCEELTYLLDKVNWRYHVFNNKKNDRTQVTELLRKIYKMVRERGHYTSELFQKAEEKRKEEQEKERMKKELEELREEWYEKPELRILLIGNTTASNRIASNIILEESLNYKPTERCQKINGEVLGRRVSVVQTPGLSDTNKKAEKEIMKEILSCICLTSPGPHAFVIVERSEQESTERKGILKLINNVFDVKAEKYVIILGIGSSEKPNQSFDNDSHSAEHSRLLKHQANKAPHEYENLPTHTLEDPRNLKQVISLLQEIDKMVKNNGGTSFTNEMYSDAERAIQKEQEKILNNRRLEITKKKCNITWGGENGYENSVAWKTEMINARKQAEKENPFIRLFIMACCATFGAGVGAALGGAAGAVVGGPVGAVAAAKAGAGIIGAVGAVVGTVVGEAHVYRIKNACNIL